MEGDEKRTLGQRVDESMKDKDLYKIEVKMIYIKPKSKSPEPGEPTKETR